MKSEYLSTDFCLDSSVCSDCWKVSEHKNAKGEHATYQNQGHNKAQPKTALPAV